jgi:hypothetical protein
MKSWQIPRHEFIYKLRDFDSTTSQSQRLVFLAQRRPASYAVTLWARPQFGNQPRFVGLKCPVGQHWVLTKNGHQESRPPLPFVSDPTRLSCLPPLVILAEVRVQNSRRQESDEVTRNKDAEAAFRWGWCRVQHDKVPKASTEFLLEKPVAFWL